MSLQGILSTYPLDPSSGGPVRAYPYFTSGKLSSSKAVIFIGGLTNGMMDPGYLPPLSFALENVGWKLVQMHWSSAYTGFGRSCLDKDVKEMECLVKHLLANGTKHIVLMGHSTGSQDVAQYLSTLSTSGVVGGIMQAPVSDRDYIEQDRSSPEGLALLEALPRAKELVENGKGDEGMGVKFCGVELSAYRLWSLGGVGGDDDYFSSDLPSQPDGIHSHPLSESFGKFNTPALSIFSEKDEYTFPKNGLTQNDLGKRWKEHAKRGLEFVVIPGANHAVEDKVGRERLCEVVVGWLGGLQLEE